MGKVIFNIVITATPPPPTITITNKLK